MSQKEKWKIERLSTPKRIINKIKARMDQPIGIIVVGIDGSFKERFTVDLVLKLGDFASSGSKVRDLEHLSADFAGSKAVVVVLNSEDSCDHEKRHKTVKLMEEAGAKTTVMFYVDADKYPVQPSMQTYAAAKFTSLNNQIDIMRCNEPTPEGVDYLITVSETV